MTVEHFETTLSALLSRRPFQPFTIELNTGKRYEVDDPQGLAHHEGAAVFFAPGGVPVFFDHESMTQILNSPAHSAPGRKRKPNHEK